MCALMDNIENIEKKTVYKNTDSIRTITDVIKYAYHTPLPNSFLTCLNFGKGGDILPSTEPKFNLFVYIAILNNHPNNKTIIAFIQ